MQKKETHKKFEWLIALLITLYVFWVNLLENISNSTIISGILLMSFFYLFVRYKESLKGNNYTLVLFYVFFLFLLMLNIFSSDTQATTVNIVTLRFQIFLIGLVLMFYPLSFFVKLIKLIYINATVHILILFLQYINFDLVQRVILANISPNLVEAAEIFYIRGSYTGLTYQTGVLAFYVALHYLITLIYFVYNKHKLSFMSKFSLLLIGIIDLYGILLTDKRGHLITIVLITFIIWLINSKVKYKFLILLGAVISFSSVILIGINKSDLLIYLNFDSINEYSSGRMNLYTQAYELFLEKPIFGWGVGYFNAIYGIGTHNIYLQIMSEMGLVGLISLLSIILVALSYTIRLIKQSNQINYYYMISLTFQLFFVIYGFTGNPINDPFMLLTYCISIAIINIKMEGK